MNKKIKVAFLFAFAGLFAQGQVLSPGYIINNQGDTIHGFLNLRSNNENALSCQFVKDQGGKITEYKPFEINGYRVENEKFYVSKEVSIEGVQQKIFLEYLVNGIADLYYYKEGTQDFYFIEKNGKTYQLSNKDKSYTDSKGRAEYSMKTNQYIGVLSYLYSDASNFSPQIRNTQFSYKSLIRTTKGYNQLICKDSTCIDYTKNVKTKVYLEPNVGIGYSVMNYKYSNDVINAFALSSGAYLRLSPPFFSKQWNTLIGINFLKTKYEGIINDNKLGGGVYMDHRINLDLLAIQIPLMIEYSLNKEKIVPFMFMGGNLTYIVSEKHSIYRVVGNSDNTEIVFESV